MEPKIEEEEEESTNQGLQTIRSRHSRDISIDSTRTSVGLNLFPEIFENSQELLKTIKFLKLENYLLEEHLKREEPVLLEGMTEYVAQVSLASFRSIQSSSRFKPLFLPYREMLKIRL